VTRDF